MWWAPEGEREELVRGDVERLEAWFHETRRDGRNFVWGVGSVWNSHKGSLFPFAVLNAHFRKRWLRNGAEKTVFPLLALSPQAADDLRLPGIELPLHATFAYRPVTASTTFQRARSFIADQIYVRDYVYCSHTGRRGTAGVRVIAREKGEIGLLTAGHTFPDGAGTGVERRRWPRLGPLSAKRSLGTISHHISPRPGIEDWDAAVIAPFHEKIKRARAVTQCLRRLDRDEAVFAHGARSGFMSDAILINAALTSHGDERRTWKNVWLVTPGGILRPGDSGTAVFTVGRNALVGLYVGSARTPLGRAAHHYVQDAWSIRDQVLTPWGFDYC